MIPQIAVIRTDEADPAIPLPAYETPGSAGADIRANLDPDRRMSGLTLAPGERALVPTGLRIAIPSGFEVQVRPRSGLALKKGLTLVNTPGTIDSDYRGPLGVILINLGHEPVRISHGDRVAQLVVAPVVQGAFALVENFDETARGTGGFGSTGVA